MTPTWLPTVLQTWQPVPAVALRRRLAIPQTPPTAGKKFSAPRTLRDFVIVARAPKKK